MMNSWSLEEKAGHPFLVLLSSQVMEPQLGSPLPLKADLIAYLTFKSLELLSFRRPALSRQEQ